MVCGTFTFDFLHQLLSTLVLNTLEQSGHPAMIALVQDWRRQYGFRVDVDMFACPDTYLITVRPAHAKFHDISQLLLDLQTLVLVASPLTVAPQKTLMFAVFSSSPVSSRSRASNRVQRSPVSSSSGGVKVLFLLVEAILPILLVSWGVFFPGWGLQSLLVLCWYA